MAESKPKLSIKSKETILITAIAIVVASLVFFVWPGVGQKQVRVPQELILGQVIDSSNVRLEFPDLSKVGLIQFNTGKSLEELRDFYDSYLLKNNWVKIFSKKTERSFQMSFQNNGTGDKINISIFFAPADNARMVAIIYSEK